MKRFLGISSAVVLVGLACFFSVSFSQERSDRDDRKSVHGSRQDINEERNRDAHPPDGDASRAKARGNGITYHGGPVILGTTNVYYIWYGNWSGNTATTILTDLAGNIGGSPYFNINTTYYNGSNTHVLNAVVFHGSTFDSYSHGTSLSDSAIQAIVSGAISSGALPKDTNGVYFVLTSSDVTASSGFCTQYCGWHTHGTISGSDIKYSFVGNPDRCPSACEAQTKGPNGNAGADGMASIISHELEETVTDPDLNAWYDSRGAENADKCAWTFGTTYTSNGALANMRLGSRDYLIQRNWVNASGGLCALKYP
jgi:Phosphate-induced protein 1 conserved region